MKKMFVLIIVLVALVGLSILIVQAYSVGGLSLGDSNEYSPEGNLITGDKPTSHGAAATRRGGCWYRDEFGRLFNVNEPHHNVVSICIRRGDHPSKIFASDQEALGLTDAELTAMGYTKNSSGNWEQ
jgi:hypothetical protein